MLTFILSTSFTYESNEKNMSAYFGYIFSICMQISLQVTHWNDLLFILYTKSCVLKCQTKHVRKAIVRTAQTAAHTGQTKLYYSFVFMSFASLSLTPEMCSPLLEKFIHPRFEEIGKVRRF